MLTASRSFLFKTFSCWQDKIYFRVFSASTLAYLVANDMRVSPLHFLFFFFSVNFLFVWISIFVCYVTKAFVCLYAYPSVCLLASARVIFPDSHFCLFPVVFQSSICVFVHLSVDVSAPLSLMLWSPHEKKTQMIDSST